MHVAAEGSDVHYFLGDYQTNLTIPICGNYFVYASLSPAFSEPIFTYTRAFLFFRFSILPFSF